MRADRLLSELLLLQVHGKMKAVDLAQELEVSERTIYRDMLALSISGIPIVAEQGVNGGYSLIDGYQTHLTGMNDQELRALFALNIPAILGALGMEEPLNSAMRKLQAALPAARGNQGKWMQQRFYFDAAPWHESTNVEVQSHLNVLQNAIWNDHKVIVDLELYPFSMLYDLQMDPYALVTKENKWYLIARRKGSFNVRPVDEIRKVVLQNECFEREIGFDLLSFWQKWLKDVKEGQKTYQVKAWVRIRHWRDVVYWLRDAIEHSSGEEKNGWREICLRFNNIHDARNQLLSWGSSLRVTSPDPLRLAIADYAQQIALLYAESDAIGSDFSD